MQDKVHAEGSMILYGVPKVSYSNKDVELTPFLSSLRSCLTYNGQDMSYARLMAGSGAAFRLMWNTTCWDGGNVDILVMRPDRMEPIHAALRTAGRTARFSMKTGSRTDKEEMVSLIRSEIDAGRPLVGFGIIGPPEACVITGYQDGGEKLLGWNYFQTSPEWQGGLAFDPSGYFIRSGWFEHPETLGIMAIGPAGDAPSGVAFLKEVVERAIIVMEAGRVGDFASGASAFDAWRGAMLDETQFPAGAPLLMLMERLMCQCDAVTMVSEGRSYASLHFAREAESMPEWSGKLQELARSFRQTHDVAMQMPPLYGFGMDEGIARKLAGEETRQAIADLISKARNSDQVSLALLREMRKELKP